MHLAGATLVIVIKTLKYSSRTVYDVLKPHDGNGESLHAPEAFFDFKARTEESDQVSHRR